MAQSPVSIITPEKPFHYSYLKEFRVEQCQLFLQHKCTQHRPFTCFNWHFMNQRRRRPIRKKDGTFNYSPDVYCPVYEETTGVCSNGDECPYLHRNAGDTERRYHLRYYKTSTCVYETDSRGFCMKNGAHCAFAHGPSDLRQPVYDIRELQGEDEERTSLLSAFEKDKGVLVDDSRWQDHSYVLTYYKIESCRRPPRLCRQGYACPFFHNNKDRRRSPKFFKYRSTPCPNVKINDEWGDPSHCENGDSCSYCHSRTEQQFHPEIYKSTRCNDIQQTGYCPRGPFCAFAHGDAELSAPRELTDEPLSIPSPVASMSSTGSTSGELDILSTSPGSKITRPSDKPSTPSFQRAPGSGLPSKSPDTEEGQTYFKKQFQAIDSDASLDETERNRRKQNILKLSLISAQPPSSGSPHVVQPSSLPSSVSETLEAMVGTSLDDLSLDDLVNTTIQDAAETPEVEAPSSSLFGTSPVAQGLLQTFSPRSTPSMQYSTPLGPLSPYGSGSSTSHGVPAGQRLPSHMFGTSAPGPPSSTSPLFMIGHGHSPAPPSGSQKGHPRRLSQSATTGSPDIETQMAREEIAQARSKIFQYEQMLRKAKSSYEALKRELDNTKSILQHLEQERELLQIEKKTLQSLLGDTGTHSSCKQHLKTLSDVTDLGRLSLTELEGIAAHIKGDLNRIEQVLRHRLSTMCVQCRQFARSVAFQPCGHCVLCDKCTEILMEEDHPTCLHCKALVNSWSVVKLPP